MIKILLVDDQAAARVGLKLRLGLETDLEVLGEAVDGEDAIAQATRLAPDVVVMDVAMPNMDGIDATRVDLRIVRLPSRDVEPLRRPGDEEASERCGRGGVCDEAGIGCGVAGGDTKESRSREVEKSRRM